MLGLEHVEANIFRQDYPLLVLQASAMMLDDLRFSEAASVFGKRFAVSSAMVISSLQILVAL